MDLAKKISDSGVSRGTDAGGGAACRGRPFYHAHLDQPVPRGGGFGVFKRQLYLSLTNAAGETVRKIDAACISTKRGSHGHGLKRIDRMVEKYDGCVNRQNVPGGATEILPPAVLLFISHFFFIIVPPIPQRV